MMQKIKMTTPLVEIDGDEMTRIIWDWIKEILIKPYVDLKTEYYDLSLTERDKTNDKITIDCARASLKYGVAVKCATITPNAERVKEYNLKEMYKSPNGTIRAIMDGTVFRSPIIVDGITPYIPNWKQPIIIARHAYGDVYKDVETKVKKGSKVELVVTDKNNNIEKLEVFDFKDTDGIALSMYNTQKSIESFAHSCFKYALSERLPLWFSTKDTISKKYDHTFKDIFEEMYNTYYKAQFEKAGLYYMYTLIDDAVARVVKSDGGFVWALKNYDGDVMSDMVATAFGSLAMMTSVLVSPDGKYEYEAAHGTVTRHYYQHREGKETSTNSMATIFAWTGALKKRGELDGNKELVAFAEKLEKASIKTIEEGVMTKDLVALFNKKDIKVNAVNTKDFLLAIKEKM